MTSWPTDTAPRLVPTAVLCEGGPLHHQAFFTHDYQQHQEVAEPIRRVDPFQPLEARAALHYHRTHRTVALEKGQLAEVYAFDADRMEAVELEDQT